MSTNTIYYLIEYDSGLGIDGSDVQNKINIYPNPFENLIKFESNSNLAIELITIFDNVGKEVIRVNTYKDYQNGIDVSSLQNGVYIVNMKFENGTQISRRLTK